MRFFAFLVFVSIWLPPCTASLIDHNDVVAVPAGVTGSGNGTLDLRMFTFSGSEIDNQDGPFDGDNGNNSLPHNNSAATFTESYVTTAGELQDFFELNFPNGSGGSTVNEIVLSLDLNENNGTEAVNNGLSVVDFYLNPTSIGGNPNPVGNDVTSDEQAAINQVSTGGTLMANLSAAITLGTVSNGGGHADYVIFTGINPFTLNAGDVVLLNISMTGLSNGSEEIFLSGTYAGANIVAAIPEASAFAFGVLACGIMGVAIGGRRLTRLGGPGD